MKQEENVPEIEKETHRLAVVNMDWNQVKVSYLKNSLFISSNLFPSVKEIDLIEP